MMINYADAQARQMAANAAWAFELDRPAFDRLLHLIAVRLKEQCWTLAPGQSFFVTWQPERQDQFEVFGEEPTGLGIGKSTWPESVIAFAVCPRRATQKDTPPWVHVRLKPMVVENASLGVKGEKVLVLEATGTRGGSGVRAAVVDEPPTELGGPPTSRHDQMP